MDTCAMRRRPHVASQPCLPPAAVLALEHAAGPLTIDLSLKLVQLRARRRRHQQQRSGGGKGAAGKTLQRALRRLLLSAALHQRTTPGGRASPLLVLQLQGEAGG